MSSQILTDNFLASDRVASITVSSEETLFPASNTYEFKRRSSIWTTKGAFEVFSGSNTIIFRETTGVDITATITPGKYGTPNDMFVAVLSAIDFAGASTYNGSYNTTTKLFNFNSDLSGGGGIFEIYWTNPQSLAMADLLGFIADDTGSSTYFSDEIRIMSAEFLEIDFGMSANPDAIVVSWRSDEVVALSEDATLLIEANHTNSFSSPSFSLELPKNDYAFFTSKASTTLQGLADAPYRFWRLSIKDKANPVGSISIGSVFIGDWTNFDRGQIQMPFSMQYVTGSKKSTTDGGSIIGRKKYTLRSFDAEWFGLNQNEKEILDEFNNTVSTVSPFYILLDSNNVLDSITERSLMYVRYESQAEWTMDFPGTFSAKMSLREEI